MKGVVVLDIVRETDQAMRGNLGSLEENMESAGQRPGYGEH